MTLVLFGIIQTIKNEAGKTFLVTRPVRNGMWSFQDMLGNQAETGAVRWVAQIPTSPAPAPINIRDFLHYAAPGGYP